MEFENEFTVPVGVDRAFEILTDLERVAPCLPGATLEEVDGAAYTGKVKVKVGPITVTYRGTAEVVEADAEAKHAVIDASGKEARGAGTASATVTADLSAVGDEETAVRVVTDLSITGKPAQFGRGVMGDVGTKLIDTFAERLAAMVAEQEGTTAGAPLPPSTAAPEAAAAPAPSGSPAGEAGPSVAPAGAAPTSSPPPGPRRVAPPAQEPEALDLMEVAGGAVGKRVVPLVAVLVTLAGLVWWWRRR
ncbi:carbon monoxide dehydrogenase [Nitriliruptoraceae bacterium ZYF776]|nr:carbon monoxide dehydrogenase [Profundirhabdus halotolerans]